MLSEKTFSCECTFILPFLANYYRKKILSYHCKTKIILKSMFETLNPIFVCVCRLVLSLLSSCRSTHHTIIHGPHLDAVCPVLSEEAAMSSFYITIFKPSIAP